MTRAGLRVRAAALLATWLAPGLACAEGDAVPAAPPRAAPCTVGFVAPADAAVARDLADGATLAAEERGRAGRTSPRVVVRAVASAWGSAGSVTVALARQDRADVVVAPPDAATAHEVVQLASKVALPVLSTASAPSVAGTGSPWCVPLEPGSGDARPAPARFVAGFALRFRRAPGPAAWAAYRACGCVATATEAGAATDAVARREALRAAARADAGARDPWTAVARVRWS